MPGAYSLYSTWNNNTLAYGVAVYKAISSTALNIVGDTIVLFNKYIVSINNGATKNIAIVNFDTTALQFTEVLTIDVPQLVGVRY